ncbi:CLUMA_CG016433, isoform A [Clunio marinus]|uniref:CLUMA_CG016433, isoform A n=1 Tax=Clunio marinus TaxID=568069 RepID=A0A1J1IV27_9DIPT|nr:CLUMA_CG016433, isoform A [Clunio marinus]
MLCVKFVALVLLISFLHVLEINTFEVEECPDACHCTMDGLLMLVDCSGLELTDLPEFPDNQIHILDLSNNHFKNVPPQLRTFEYLQYLDLSQNHIRKLPSDSLSGMLGLRLLNLSKNNISNWMAINPRTLLEPALSLTELSLAENPITSFSTNDDNLLLVSNSLQLLDLSRCKISKVTGEQILQGMKKLKHLNLAGNHIRSVSSLISDSLLTLDLSHNRLTNLLPNMLENLPSLTYIDLSRNHRISLQNKQGEFVSSISLKRIDLSHCNMDDIELEGFPDLTTAILRGNMIRELSRDSFISTKMIENIDLAENAINTIDSNTFRKLKHLKTLNLSFNLIPRIERDTFKENELLTKLDLSRNTISRFNRITASSLTHLNLTYCQIMTIDSDLLFGTPELVNLDLSHNLINDIPDTLSSDNLQVLDLSMNRMTNIRNQTFAGLPDLSIINLSGNRFTTPFRTEFFSENLYLTEIHLGDNPWFCNCVEMHSFYIFLTSAPAKLWEKQTLRCQSPEDVAGSSWESACYYDWYPPSRMGTTEKVWTFFMVTVIAFSGCMCLIMTIKRGIEGREQTAREQERERNIEEGREISRQNRVRMEQQAQRDAPDPRESRPPCYADAILMPRPDGSFASLNELGNGRIKAKRHRRKSENEDENDEYQEDVPLRRNRCRSEEVISMRETVRPSRLFPRIHPQEIEPISRSEDEQESPDSVHYHSTDILTLDHSPGPSSRARSPQISLQPETTNTIDNQNDNTEGSGSPYARRKLKHMESFKGNNKQQLKIVTKSLTPPQDGIQIYEDHFQPIRSEKRNSTTDSEDSSEFITIKPGMQTDSNSSVDEDDLVVIKRPTSF